MTTQTPQKLEIAILGAGIAGLTLFIALSSHPLLTVTIYERATVLREIGASIALGPNGLRTLSRLGLNEIITEESGFRGTGKAGMFYRHWRTNEVIGEEGFGEGMERKFCTARFLRSDLQKGLLGHADESVVKLGKRVVGVEEVGEKVKVSFEDGSEISTDLVVGADGLHSAVRQTLIPDLKLKWTGWTAFRSVFPASLADHIPELPEDSAHWWGPDTSFFASRLGGGMYTIVGGIQVDPDDPSAQLKDVKWDLDGDIEVLREKYKGWHPAIEALTEITPSIRYYPNFAASEPLSTLVFGNRVTLIGDAAHPHGGAYATGGSLAIDDAFCLFLALKSIFPVIATAKISGKQIRQALELYEITRKPHVEKLTRMVGAANERKIEGLRRGVVESDEGLRKRSGKAGGMAWCNEHDVLRAFEEAVKHISDIL